ncbi:TonB-dependent receptor [Eilatimonas milleporae]|uniref:TonB-dependent receptor-like protein n=1 Tax=Eilatimonas milleporae TaxID=911205 RepID=A0A3M0CD48_9PROT|nr:TonB-dependent receptor [Eilatimonas milleporae]RMB07668.1 TonB-dependent receptor-like protein [Eilatimonas milleporae]
MTDRGNIFQGTMIKAVAPKKTAQQKMTTASPRGLRSVPLRSTCLRSVFGSVSVMALAIGLSAAQGSAALADAAADAAGQQGARTGAVPLQETARFDLSRRPLDKALIDFSLQADARIFVSQDLLTGKQATPVTGTMPRGEALRRLLQGTGLEYREDDSGRIHIVPIGASDLGASTDTGARVQYASVASMNRQTDAAYGAQVSQQGPVNADDDGGPRSFFDDLDEEEVEEIRVTGSNIRGVGVSAGSNVIVIGRQEIDQSGFATTQEILQALPQNFGGGVNEGGVTQINQSGASTINLRGLGASATLVLVNGRRVPAAGSDGSFVDISTIPATAIKRVEVLADGASAVYGSDAIAGVTNIILRDDFEGAETRLRFGTVTDGDTQEYQLGQTFGTTWNNGHALLSYEYYKRDPLARADRDFTATTDLTAFGGDDFRTSRSNPGNILDPVTRQPVFAIPEGQDGTNLQITDLLPNVVNLSNQNEGQDQLPRQERHTFFLSGSQSIDEEIEFFFEGNYGLREFATNRGRQASTLSVPSSNPFFVNPFDNDLPVLIDYDFLEDLGPISELGEIENYSGLLGMTIALSDTWYVDAYGFYGERKRDFTSSGFINFSALSAALADSDPRSAFNPFGDGSNTDPATLDQINLVTDINSQTSTFIANAMASGSLFDIPGGEVKAVFGVEYREETFETQLIRSDNFSSNSDFKRDVAAIFSEVNIPLFSEENGIPGFKKLLLSASLRHENYGGIVDASTTNPKLGLLWSPIKGISFRSSFGTSFRVPDFLELDVNPSSVGAIARILPDHLSQNGTSTQLLYLGSNADLENETATTWTIGADFVPVSLPRLALNVTYFDIDFEDRIIGRGGDVFGALSSPDNEELFGELITRNPSQLDLDAICNNQNITVFADCTEGVINSIIDGRFNNTAETKVSGLDFSGQYSFDTNSLGNFMFRVNGSYIFDFEESINPAAESIDRVDTLNSPVDLRMRNSVSWNNGNGITATSFFNYTDSYVDRISSPERKIKSHSTVDFNISYELGGDNSNVFLKNTTFSVNIINLFDNDPPFVNNNAGSLILDSAIGFDPANANPLGRFVAFNIIKTW